jgi:ABC-type transporter Mla subunit MlaD
LQAATVGATVAAVSAAISAFSSWNSFRSAKASLAALEDTREQRRKDDVRTRLGALGGVYDDCVGLIESLARDLIRDSETVNRQREKLRRSTLVAGVTTAEVRNLLEAKQPLSQAEITDLRKSLEDISSQLHGVSLNGNIVATSG